MVQPAQGHTGIVVSEESQCLSPNTLSLTWSVPVGGRLHHSFFCVFPIIGACWQVPHGGVCFGGLALFPGSNLRLLTLKLGGGQLFSGMMQNLPRLKPTFLQTNLVIFIPPMRQ